MKRNIYYNFWWCECCFVIGWLYVILYIKRIYRRVRAFLYFVDFCSSLSRLSLSPHRTLSAQIKLPWLEWKREMVSANCVSCKFLFQPSSENKRAALQEREEESGWFSLPWGTNSRRISQLDVKFFFSLGRFSLLFYLNHSTLDAFCSFMWDYYQVCCCLHRSTSMNCPSCAKAAGLSSNYRQAVAMLEAFDRILRS